MVTAEVLRRFPFFLGFTDAEVAEIAESGELTDVPAGATLFREGTPAEVLYFLLEGEMETLLLEQGVVPVTVVYPGEPTGWSALIEPYVYTSTVRATRDSRVVGFGRSALARALSNPRLASVLMQRIAEIVAKRLRDTQGRLATFLRA